MLDFEQNNRRGPLCLGLSPLREYKYPLFSREIQIAVTGEYHSEMLKCSDLHKLGSAMCYITRRVPIVGVHVCVWGEVQMFEYS